MTDEDVQTETTAGVNAGLAAAAIGLRVMDVPTPVTGFVVPLALNDGNVRVQQDLYTELTQLRPGPIHRHGTVHLSELGSFITALTRWADPLRTVVYADLSSRTVTAVLDDHAAASSDANGWRKHRLVYACPVALEWEQWIKWNGMALKQEAFARWVEAQQECITGDGKDSPSPVMLLEMARDLQVYTHGRFRRTFDPTTGTGHLLVETEHGSTSTKIPPRFRLGLRVFEGGQRYQVDARLQFSLTNSEAAFTYHLDRADEVARDAFLEVRNTVAEKTGLTVLAGHVG